MRIVLLITIVESLALMLWLAYAYHKRREANLQAMAPANALRHPSSRALKSESSSIVHKWQRVGQQDDRRIVNGSVVTRETPSTVHRSSARKSHQLMYKRWSMERHDSE